MHGIFGGFLGLLNILGGGVLLLLIGWTAATKRNRRARWARILIGSIPAGAFVGFTVPLLIQVLQDYWEYHVFEFNDLFSIELISVPLGMLAVAGIACLLEYLREIIEDQPPES
jgi:formate/nitrite transporter FocA (FNT family)